MRQFIRAAIAALLLALATVVPVFATGPSTARDADVPIGGPATQPPISLVSGSEDHSGRTFSAP